MPPSPSTLPVGRDWRRHLAEVLAYAEREVIVAAPYVTTYGTGFLRDHLPPQVRERGRVVLVTDLSPVHVAQGATEVCAIQGLRAACASFRLVHLARLHAKVYVADATAALVTSGNLTRGGLHLNFEYGTRLGDPQHVAQVRREVLAYADLGLDLDTAQLDAYAAEEPLLRRAATEAAPGAPLTEALRRARQRLAGPPRDEESYTQRFARAVRLVLREEGPMTTPEIHERVQALLPEWCDDAEERIIDGRSFGKLWKHRVRIAQQHLKQQGEIGYDGSLWASIP